MDGLFEGRQIERLDLGQLLIELGQHGRHALLAQPLLHGVGVEGQRIREEEPAQLEDVGKDLEPIAQGRDHGFDPRSVRRRERFGDQALALQNGSTPSTFFSSGSVFIHSPSIQNSLS